MFKCLKCGEKTKVKNVFGSARLRVCLKCGFEGQTTETWDQAATLLVKRKPEKEVWTPIAADDPRYLAYLATCELHRVIPVEPERWDGDMNVHRGSIGYNSPEARRNIYADKPVIQSDMDRIMGREEDHI